jgi:hypothetical protein
MPSADLSNSVTAPTRILFPSNSIPDTLAAQEKPSVNSPCPSRAHATPRLLKLLALTFLIALAHPLHAQTTYCSTADLDTTFRFGNYPPSSYVIAVISKNISTTDCALATHIPPTFYANRQPDPQPISICLDCDQPHPLGLPSAPPPVTLRPGESAHQTIRWSTSPASNTRTCDNVDVMNIAVNHDAHLPAQLIAPSLLPPICSQVDVESFALGPIFGDDDSLPNHAIPAALRLSSTRLTYNLGEPFALHAESGTSTSPATTGTRCPSFLLRQRSANGATRLQEFNTPQIHCLTDTNPDQPYLTTSFDSIPPLQPTGDATLQLYKIANSLRATRINLTESNSLTLHISNTNLRDVVPNLVSTATFKPATTPASADPTPYTGWQTNFTLTDTSFGKHSALLDQTTHLEWLRLAATRNKSQDALSHTMAPHKALEGWRFATEEEVIAFFRHFTGSPSGRTSDPAIASELQRVMGGPLATTHDNAAGWTRSITNGRIAGYFAPTSNFAPAGAPRFQYHYATIREESHEGQVTITVIPSQTGWIDGDTNTPDTGTFVVRDH